MKKEVVWGHWYPVKESTMPESKTVVLDADT